jgi:small subunit ribosomal protein S7
MQLSYEMQVNKFINLLMRCGKKNKAKNVLFKALFHVKNKTMKNPLYILKKALSNSIPVVTFVPTKRGSKYYNIPAPITHKKAIYLAISWIILGAHNRSISVSHPNLKYDFSKKLCDELIDDANGIGEAVRKKEALYSIVVENRSQIR